MITRLGRATAVVVSTAAYERLRRENISAFFDVRRDLAAEARQNGLDEDELSKLLRGDEVDAQCILFSPFCPYLSLSKPVEFADWRVGPLSAFQDLWADAKFETQAEAFPQKFRLQLLNRK